MSVVDQVTEALGKVQDPELHRSITELGMVDRVNFKDGRLELHVLLTISGCPMKDRLRTDVTSAVSSIVGITEVDLTFGVMSDTQRANVKSILRNGREKFIPFAQPDSLTRVIGVASGKGGVGKSSVTANLAIAAANQGLRVGILDADVYGHSIPRLMGLIGQRPTAIDQMFIPLESYGVKTVSMEMFKPERSDAVAYRGPLLHKVLERAGRIAHQMKQQVIGVIENMSAFPCPTCDETISLFGEGGGAETAKRLSLLVGKDVPILGQIPFSPALREGGDTGIPVVVSNPESSAAKVFDEIIARIIVRPKSLVGVRLGLST